MKRPGSGPPTGKRQAGVRKILPATIRRIAEAKSVQVSDG